MSPDTRADVELSDEQLARLERTSSNDTPDFITLDDYHVLNAALRELQQRRAQAQPATPPEPHTHMWESAGFDYISDVQKLRCVCGATSQLTRPMVAAAQGPPGTPQIDMVVTPPEPTTPAGSEPHVGPPPADAKEWTCPECGNDMLWCGHGVSAQPPSVETPAPQAEPGPTLRDLFDCAWWAGWNWRDRWGDESNDPETAAALKRDIDLLQPPAGAQPAQDVEALNSAVLDLDGMVNDHHQYPQLRMHDMQIERATRVRAALARLQGGR
jgi:hypothetical protein